MDKYLVKLPPKKKPRLELSPVGEKAVDSDSDEILSVGDSGDDNEAASRAQLPYEEEEDDRVPR